MEKKMSVVEMFESIKSVEGLSAEQIAFIDTRIEQVKKKNASKSTEPSPKELERKELTEGYKSAIVLAMEADKQYSPTELLKVVDFLPPNCSTQKLTPMLTALVKENRLAKSVVKGRTVYHLPSAPAEAEVETED